MEIYIANGLFTEAQRAYNEVIANTIRRTKKLKGHIVYLPQENNEINDKSLYANSKMIYKADNEHLDNAEVLIAIIDGEPMDSGVACEIGRAAAMGKYIIGIYTDNRQGTFNNKHKIKALDEIAESQFSYVNLYVVGAIKENGVLVSSIKAMIEELDLFLNN